MTIWLPDLEKRAGPKYIAIAEAIAADVEGGRLRPGDRLPTHRDLADRLRVTVGTVSRGYAEAERRGLLRGEVGRGTFVGPVVPEGFAFPSPEPEVAGLVDLSMNIPVLPAAVGGGQALEATLAGLRGRSDLAALLGYQPPGGALRHRGAGAVWIARSGLPQAPERVLVCSGVQHAMAVTLGTLVQPGDVLLTEALTYPGMKALASLMHLRLLGLAMDDQGLRPDALEAACKSHPVRGLYCVPNLQNPTAVVMPEKRRREIAGVAKAHGVAIVEDDCYGFLLDDPPPPIAAFAPENGYYLSSLAKSLAPGLRIGFLMAPERMVERLGEAIRTTTWMAAPLMAEIAASWIEDGTAARLLKRTRDETMARQRLAGGILRGWKYASHPRSCHLWLHLPDPWRSEDFVLEARRRGVAVTPAEAFVVGRGEAPHAVRVCLGAARSRTQLERGLQLLVGALEGRPGPHLPVP